MTSPLFVAIGTPIPALSLLALPVANVCAVIYALSPPGRTIAAFLLVLVVFVDLFAAGRATVAGYETADLLGAPPPADAQGRALNELLNQ